MPLTAEDAAKQLYEEIKSRGKFNIGNVLDSVIGVIDTNSGDLQAMLDRLLTKKGVLTQQDEAAVQELLKKAKEEQKNRQKIRTKNTIFILIAAAGVGTAIYFMVRKNKSL